MSQYVDYRIARGIEEDNARPARKQRRKKRKSRPPAPHPKWVRWTFSGLIVLVGVWLTSALIIWAAKR